MFSYNSVEYLPAKIRNSKTSFQQNKIAKKKKKRTKKQQTCFFGLTPAPMIFSLYKNSRTRKKGVNKRFRKLVHKFRLITCRLVVVIGEHNCCLFVSSRKRQGTNNDAAVSSLLIIIKKMWTHFHRVKIWEGTRLIIETSFIGFVSKIYHLILQDGKARSIILSETRFL